MPTKSSVLMIFSSSAAPSACGRVVAAVAAQAIQPLGDPLRRVRRRDTARAGERRLVLAALRRALRDPLGGRLALLLAPVLVGLHRAGSGVSAGRDDHTATLQPRLRAGSSPREGRMLLPSGRMTRVPSAGWPSESGRAMTVICAGNAPLQTEPRPPAGGRVKVRRETSGRRGKEVTTISGVPLDDAGLRELAGRLKKRCGVGGSAKQGVIELQGDHRDVVVEPAARRRLRRRARRRLV